MKAKAMKAPSLFGRNFPALPLYTAFGLTAYAQAQELGLKPETAPPPLPAPVITPASLLQMLIALAIVVLLLRFALPKLLQRIPKNLTPSSGRVVVLDATPTPYGHLYLVKAVDRMLLLGISPQTISVLCEWEEEKSMPGGFRSPAESDPAFQEILKRLQQLES